MTMRRFEEVCTLLAVVVAGYRRGLRLLMCAVQVRRKADGAKNLVKEWLTDWRDSPLVAQDPSHSQIRGKALLQAMCKSRCHETEKHHCLLYIMGPCTNVFSGADSISGVDG